MQGSDREGTLLVFKQGLFPTILPKAKRKVQWHITSALVPG